MSITNTLTRRLYDKFLIGDGCWEWTASLNDSGYGQVAWQGKPLRAHRVVYEWLVGPIPEGMTLDHLCRNRKCVRPDHLEPVTRGENVRRGIAAEKTRERAQALTHCKRGHEFTEENTAIIRLTNGYLARRCKACRRKS